MGLCPDTKSLSHSQVVVRLGQLTRRTALHLIHGRATAPVDQQTVEIPILQLVRCPGEPHSAVCVLERHRTNRVLLPHRTWRRDASRHKLRQSPRRCRQLYPMDVHESLPRKVLPVRQSACTHLPRNSLPAEQFAWPSHFQRNRQERLFRKRFASRFQR
jgi:hypothetical protein